MNMLSGVNSTGPASAKASGPPPVATVFFLNYYTHAGW